MAARVKNDQVASLVRAVMVKRQPGLEGALRVRYDRRPAFLFRVSKGAGRVSVVFTISPTHPSFMAVLDRCARAAGEIRYGTTTSLGVTGREASDGTIEEQGGPACEGCHRVVVPGARYCVGCGAEIPERAAGGAAGENCRAAGEN